jgi:hypothetical protein
MVKIESLTQSAVKSLQFGKLPMSEVKVKCQPHIVYVDTNMKKQTILVGIVIKTSDVSKT